MILERLKQFIDYKGISVSGFERSIGMSNASFAKSLKNKKAIGTDKLENILKIYPEINPTWLLSGKGPMILSKKTKCYSVTGSFPDQVNEDPGNLITHNASPSIIEYIKTKDRRIEDLCNENGSLKKEIELLNRRLNGD